MVVQEIEALEEQIKNHLGSIFFGSPSMTGVLAEDRCLRGVWDLEVICNRVRRARRVNGRGYRIRTDDIYLVRVALYQLS